MFLLVVFGYTPTGNHTGQPLANFAQRSIQGRLRSARYARLHSAAPGWSAQSRVKNQFTEETLHPQASGDVQKGGAIVSMGAAAATATVEIPIIGEIGVLTGYAAYGYGMYTLYSGIDDMWKASNELTNALSGQTKQQYLPYAPIPSYYDPEQYSDPFDDDCY